METLDVINKRKSVRGYEDRQISEDELETIMGVANRAPNAGPLHFTVIQDNELITAINDKTKEFMLASEGFMKERASIPGYEPLYGAPTLIIISSPELPFAQINVACSATTMILTATDLGLGSCYVVSPIQTVTEDFADILNLPEGFAPVSGVIVGYESESAIPTPERQEADNIDYI